MLHASCHFLFVLRVPQSSGEGVILAAFAMVGNG
jgi:hypothetical protein